MAKQVKKVSSSDMTARNVVGTRKRGVAAMVSGAQGGALADKFIQEWTNVGKIVTAMRTSMKDKLLLLIGMDAANLVAFHKAMMDKAEEINNLKVDAQTADETITNLAKFFEFVRPELETVYQECNRWKRLALAVDGGWRPTAEHVRTTKFMDLCVEATARIEAAGKSGESAPNVAKGKSGQGRGKPKQVPKTPQQKAVNAAKSALKDEKGEALPKNNRNIAEVVRGILSDATVEELVEVAAVVEAQLIAARKVQEDAAKAIAKVQNAVDKGQTKPADPTPRRVKAAGKEHAAAKAK